MEEDDLQQAIVDDCLPRYPSNEPPKQVQVDAVKSLVHGRHTFVMAGTGCGKSRISEMYYNLFAKTKKAVILVLNPLDALGDNQVKEKIAQGYTAVNLKKLTFNQTVADDIEKGKYNFVYLSPEVFLNNQMFTDVYHNTKFQDRLALIVVDEAHMIYSWGLVSNKKAKKSSAHKRHQDRAVFRPSYGDLGRQLMTTEGTPILFLSATCRPKAVREILKSLKIPEETVNFVRAELTRPEIRILRFPMKSSLKSANDLLPMFGRKEDIKSSKIVPTLIYSGTRNATFQVMKVVNKARGTSGEEYNPDKDTINGYEAGNFPCISCTMALGLGQNWKRVRRVIHMGRGDPSCICQMIGRCGRDGKPGLAVLFMERKRKFGLNSPEAIARADRESDDVRMDSFAITPVCLRIAISVDNLYGYIPMDHNDLNYIREEAREEEEGFPTCRCSNCAPEEAKLLMAKMKEMNIKLSPLMQNLTSTLVDQFNKFFADLYGKSRSFFPGQIFGPTEADAIARNFDKVNSKSDIVDLIGSEQLDGELNMLDNCIKNFKEGTDYQSYLKDQEDYETFIGDEMERIQNLKKAGLKKNLRTR
ncbi:hypothetical protein PTTG_26366 [Puccinia triticina 1-1 BBBD Race 1]|uniref:DNA 3'-5' helicase n=1 Tax=Puccinia triticina (isolate 1-1 / race 1 (BBBD)) TaxID=630390 RepID=A0A180GVP7_PUCT1|nr:hypothetical protein PTTG_26366 [Puccinia triticina 1-1 BBBD Race 1]